MHSWTSIIQTLNMAPCIYWKEWECYILSTWLTHIISETLMLPCYNCTDACMYVCMYVYLFNFLRLVIHLVLSPMLWCPSHTSSITPSTTLRRERHTTSSRAYSTLHLICSHCITYLWDSNIIALSITLFLTLVPSCWMEHCIN